MQPLHRFPMSKNYTMKEKQYLKLTGRKKILPQSALTHARNKALHFARMQGVTNVNGAVTGV